MLQDIFRMATKQTKRKFVIIIFAAVPCARAAQSYRICENKTE